MPTQTGQTRGAPNAANPAQAYAKADELMRSGRVADAEVIYRSLLEAFPNDVALVANLALAVKAGGDTAEAEVLFRKAIDLQPQEPAFHNNLGNLLRARGALEEAETCYRRAIARQANYAEAYYNLGNVLENTNRAEEAMVAYRRAVAIRPDYSRALTCIGALLIKRRDFSEALAPLDAALAAQPDLFDALYYRGWALSGLNRHDEAIISLQRATALRPEWLEPNLALANALRDAGSFDEALATYWKIIELQPEFVQAHYALNTLAWSLGRSDLHMRSFTLARELRGNDPELLFLEAGLRTRLGEHGEVERLMRIAHALAPERTDITSLLASSLARQGKFDESFGLFSWAITTDPTSVKCRQEFGYALLSGKEPREAIRLFNEARALAPFDQLALSGLALAHREIGDSRYKDFVDLEKLVKVYEFPSPENVGAFNRELAAALAQLHTAKFAPLDQTLRGGTQTTGTLFDSEARAINQLREFCDQAIADYIGSAPKNSDHPLYMGDERDFAYSGSWSCALRPGGFHDNHVHPLGRISSVYYVAVPEAVDDEKRQQGWLKFGESCFGLGENDRAERLIKPVAGRLVLFPSFYWHGTVPFDGAEERLTVAFDVSPGRQEASRPPHN